MTVVKHAKYVKFPAFYGLFESKQQVGRKIRKFSGNKLIKMVSNITVRERSRMSSFEGLLVGRKRRSMFFQKSITFDGEELNQAVLAARSNTDSTAETAETPFLEKLRAGDPVAFDQLVTRYSGDIYGLLVKMTEDLEEAKDLTQETFLRALRNIKSFRGEADIKTWLFRIAINESRNRYRWWKRRRRDMTVSLEAENGEVLGLSERIASPASEDPEMAAINHERGQALHKALTELPQNYREVVILRDIEGLTYEEIAGALQTNVGTVKSRIARGREELRRKLKGI
jgi:RNA polymerase sigma-70 factor, ECF subfamily